MKFFNVKPDEVISCQQFSVVKEKFERETLFPKMQMNSFLLTDE